MLTLVTPPGVEPVDLATAKLHLRVDIPDDDTLITALITGVRLKLESHLSRSFVTTGWQLALDGFPGQFSRFTPALGSFNLGSYGYGAGPLYGNIPERFLAGTGEPIVIPKARLIAVSSITYLDSNGTRQTLDPSLYSVEPGDGGRISPAYTTTWPAGRVYPGAVEILFTMGYGSTAAAVPFSIVQAMLMLISHLYYNRDAVADFAASELPLGVKWFLASEDWGCRP